MSFHCAAPCLGTNNHLWLPAQRRCRVKRYAPLFCCIVQIDYWNRDADSIASGHRSTTNDHAKQRTQNCATIERTGQNATYRQTYKTFFNACSIDNYSDLVFLCSRDLSETFESGDSVIWNTCRSCVRPFSLLEPWNPCLRNILGGHSFELNIFTCAYVLGRRIFQ